VHVNQVALGFRRLSIVDLAGGHQPLSNEDGSIWLVFNGEIYNHETLRRELVAQGHRFRSRSIPKSSCMPTTMGTSLRGKLRGIFAFAIWDRNEGPCGWCATTRASSLFT
jgi:asparagine synthase (glutamine-hydrolysing)